MIADEAASGNPITIPRINPTPWPPPSSNVSQTAIIKESVPPATMMKQIENNTVVPPIVRNEVARMAKCWKNPTPRSVCFVRWWTTQIVLQSEGVIKARNPKEMKGCHCQLAKKIHAMVVSKSNIENDRPNEFSGRGAGECSVPVVKNCGALVSLFKPVSSLEFTAAWRAAFA